MHAKNLGRGAVPPLQEFTMKESVLLNIIHESLVICSHVFKDQRKNISTNIL